MLNLEDVKKLLILRARVLGPHGRAWRAKTLFSRVCDENTLFESGADGGALLKKPHAFESAFQHILFYPIEGGEHIPSGNDDLCIACHQQWWHSSIIRWIALNDAMMFLLHRCSMHGSTQLNGYVRLVSTYHWASLLLDHFCVSKLARIDFVDLSFLTQSTLKSLRGSLGSQGWRMC